MRLTAPLIIGPRLLPAVKLGDADTGGIVSLDPSDLTWYIDPFDPDTEEASGGEFNVPRFTWQTDEEWVRVAMRSLLNFLSTFADAHHPTWGGGEHRDLFPEHLGEWAYLNHDEIEMAAEELSPDPEEDE